MFDRWVAEVRRTGRETYAYRFNVISTMALWLVAFPLMMMVFDSVAGYGPVRQMESLIGFLVWDLCMAALAAIGQDITREAQHGTLEAILMAPVAPLRLFLMRSASAAVTQSVLTAVLGIALFLILRLPAPHLSLGALVVLLLTVAGVIGVSLAIGGIALIYKRVASIVGVIGLLSVLLSGALVPLNSLGPLYQVLKWFVPMTWGISVLRAMLIGDIGAVELARQGVWLGLTLQTCAFLGIGALVFGWGFHRARVAGILGSY